MACLACGRRAGPSDQRAEVHLVMRLASKLVASYVHQHNAVLPHSAWRRTVAPLSGGFRKGPLS